MSIAEIAPIIDIILIFLLVIITAYYAWQTKASTDVSRMALLYQRKPQFITKIENNKNEIYCTLKNDRNSISPVINIDAKIYMKVNRKKMNIGEYHIDGPLFPGEEDSPDITPMIRKNLIKLKLMAPRKEKENIPKQDEKGNLYLPIGEFFDITKRKIVFAQ